MDIPRVCILLFVREVANAVDPWLATERYNMSVLLIFFTINMVVAATFLMFCNKSVLYLSVHSSTMISLLKTLVKKVMIPSFFLCSLPGSGSSTVAITACDLNNAVHGAQRNWNRVELGAFFSRLKKKRYVVKEILVWIYTLVSVGKKV